MDERRNGPCAEAEIAEAIGISAATGWVVAVEPQVRSALGWHGRPFPYLVLCASTPVSAVYVREHMLARRLAQTNTYDADDLIAFASLFGLPASPLYESKDRRERFRARREGLGFVAVADADDLADLAIPATLTEAKRGLGLFDPVLPQRAYADDVLDEGGLLAPALETEIARGIEAPNADVLDVVSVSEAAQALRLMQVAVAYADLIEGTELGLADVEDVAVRLEERLRGKGQAFFSRAPDPLFAGRAIAPYRTVCRDPSFLAQLMGLADPDPRWRYLVGLHAALERNARSVRIFLDAATDVWAGAGCACKVV